ncbi:hypothetical protein [uncultured Roseovarius sp.]|uniref:hypothetical protein n=1 Tax=uncultured Roseovarius sp. TaxID=293344 RepID=UPI00260A541B|nr:hypothetical protein [uncultured Roseovarius sp.]
MSTEAASTDEPAPQDTDAEPEPTVPKPEMAEDTAGTTDETNAEDRTEPVADTDAQTTSETETDTPPTAPGAIYASNAETDPTPSPVVRTEQVHVRKGGFWSMVLGGAVAAGLGVYAAPYVLPPDWFTQADDQFETQVEAALSEHDAQLADLGSRLEGFSVPPDLSDEIDGLGETMTALTEQISELETRVAALEDRPAPTGDGTGPSSEDLSALRSSLEEQAAELEAQGDALETLRSDAEARESAARDSALGALRRAALTRVMTALDSGSEYTAALDDLRETGAEVPAALADQADSGVPTQSALTDSFPEAARAALAAARAETDDIAEGVGGFLKNQLGIRSLSPREGDDPDAILSRAEAALAEGRLGDALSEIEALPEGARAALDGWAAEATRRQEALSAAEALADHLN